MTVGMERVDLAGALSWRFIGPPRGGRVVAVAGDPSDRLTFYFGSCGGGVFKTTDAGVTWRNVSDGYFDSAAVGALALAPSDPGVLYVGTGEACPRNDVIAGDGVYRSTDGGRTFEHRGLGDTRHIARVRVSPRDPDLVFVAALGDIYGPSPHRGVYRSADGGAGWTLVLPGTDQAGAADLWMAPGNPRLLYATLWEFIRQPWDVRSGGRGSGLYRSSDGGEHWSDLTARPGMPKAISPDALLGRMGVAASPARPERVWVLIEAAEDLGGLYRSEDGGDHFERISENRDLLGRPWYYSHIVPDPQDADTLYALNYDFWRSVDGGMTWTEIPTAHGDNHDLWIDPADPRRMIEGNDGGACISFNGGVTFSSIYNQPTSAFYKMAIDDHFPYRVYGTQQDNSAIRVPSRSRRGAILRDDCEPVGHAESGDIVIDPRDNNVVYAGAVGSSGGGGAPLLRHDHRSGQTSLVTVWPEWTFAEDPATWPHRFAWTFPLLISAHDPSVLYAGGECLFRSTDEGHSWEAISHDLTRNDPGKLRVSGGMITKDTSGAEVYCTLSSLAESAADPTVLFVGNDDGLVHRTIDGGMNWETVTIPGLPEWAWITGIEISRHDPATIYLAATRYRLQDRAPYLFKTTDGGATWISITSGIAEGDVVRVVREDPDRPGLCYVGTEHGAYVSYDGGVNWEHLSLNLPVVPVYDMKVKGGDLVVATHGRGFYVLDDGAALLRQLAADAADAAGVEVGSPAAAPRLFVPPTCYRYGAGEGPVPKDAKTQYRETATATIDRGRDGTMQVASIDAGLNPPDGLVIAYHLPGEVAAAALGLRVLSQSGAELVSFKVEEKEKTPEDAAASGTAGDTAAREGPLIAPIPRLDPSAGTHRLVWNLRVPGARLENAALAAMADEEGTAGGPRVPPGRYQLELRAGSTTVVPVELLGDPNVVLSQEAYDEQFELLLQVRDRSVAVNEALRRSRRLNDAVRRLEEREDAPDLVRAVAAEARVALEAIAERLTQHRWRAKYDCREFPAGLDGRLNTLVQTIGTGDAAPTRQARQIAEKLFAQVSEALDVLEQVVAGPIAGLNEAVATAGLPAVPLGTADTIR
jgi:photosystem II stability/assembly factor-like uncharacterized protein